MKTKPFIIVMTYGLTNEGPGPGGRRGRGAGASGGGATTNASPADATTNAPVRGTGPGGRGGGPNPFTAASAAFEKVLVGELIPYIDANFRIGIKNTAYVSQNTAHEFLTWRRSLREFAPLLFVK